MCLAADQSLHASRIPLTACKAMGGRAEAMCGSYEVFQNRGARGGRKMKLNLMVFPAQDAAPLPDPVVLPAGGQGVGAVQTFAACANRTASQIPFGCGGAPAAPATPVKSPRGIDTDILR